jgi:hypothetical protein
MALMLQLDNFVTFLQLGKSFGTQLHAKDDNLRDEAVAAMAALAKQVILYWWISLLAGN